LSDMNLLQQHKYRSYNVNSFVTILSAITNIVTFNRPNHNGTSFTNM